MITEYSLSYSIDILSKDKVTFVSAPEDTVKTEVPGGFRIKYDKSNKVAKREIKIHYKTNAMMQPKLKYKVDE